VTVRPLGADRVAVNVMATGPVADSVAGLGMPLSMDSRGGSSSSTMVPTPWASATVALVAFTRSTVKVSSGSSRVSPVTWTLTVLDVSPGEKVTVPLVAV